MLLQIFAVISLLECLTASLVCLYCTDAVVPADCGTVIRCGSHEKCYVDAYVSAAGSIRYNLGCRDQNQCSGSQTIGKRGPAHAPYLNYLNKEKDTLSSSYKRKVKSSYVIASAVSKERASGYLVCSQCCNGNLCSNDACGNNGYSKPRGPICYHCDEQNSPTDCSKIRLCGQGEVCMLQKVLNPMTHAVRYMTKCAGQTTCTGEIQRYRELMALLIGKRQTLSKRNHLEIGGSCIVQCCETDLCNINCEETLTNQIATTEASSSKSTSTIISTRPYSTTAPLTFAPSIPQIYRSSLQTSSSSVLTTNTIVLSTYATPSVPTKIIPTPSEITPSTTIQTTNASGCLHDNELYREGQSWTLGCTKTCTCIDGKYNLKRCTDLCIQWHLPDVCYLSPPTPGKCCAQPVCPSYITIQYPIGYSQN